MKDRRSIRLPDYDYTWPGNYFVTINTNKKAPIFGNSEGDKTILNEFGRVAQKCWLSIPSHFENVEIDAFIVMPSHIHGILVIGGELEEVLPISASQPRQVVGATHESPVRIAKHARGPRHRSLGAIVGMYKAAVSKEIHRIVENVNTPIWHRNYYEHVIRDDQDLENIRRYIFYNAAK